MRRSSPKRQGRGRNARHSNGNKGRNPNNRGNARKQLDRYLAMAKDATGSGDRVEAEYYMQHADHYQRILNEAEEKKQAHNSEEKKAPEGNGKDHAGMNGAKNPAKSAAPKEAHTAYGKPEPGSDAKKVRQPRKKIAKAPAPEEALSKPEA